MNQSEPEFDKSMEDLWHECLGKVVNANQAASTLRSHLMSMNLNVTIGIGGRFDKPALIIYRERKVIPPVIKELVKSGWEGLQVHTTYIGKVVIKPAK